MKKIFLACVLSLCALCVSAQSAKLSAKQLRDKSFKEASIHETISCLKSNMSDLASDSDRRSVLYLTALLQEQLGLYTEASKNYAQAAGIAASDAEGMPKVSAETLVLCAVRTALCAGEFDTADSYLNSAVRSSKNENVKAYVNLYSVWSALCRASTLNETKDSVALLTAYASMQSMYPVKASVLLTLWYLTDEKQYAQALQKEFPNSPEYGITKGNVQIMSVPFWYFVPRAVHSDSSN